MDGWKVLGENGERLDELARPIKEDTEPRKREREQPPWLVCSPELGRFRALAYHLSGTTRGFFAPADDVTLSEAIKKRDGTWVARLQSVFLPASAVLVEEEVYWIADWHRSEHGTSRVYAKHQDDHEYRCVDASLAGFIAGCLTSGWAFEDIALPEETHRQLSLAREETLEEEMQDSPAHLDTLRLEPRTYWIGHLLLGIDNLGDTKTGIEHAPDMGHWQQERPLCEEWPHLQAYWLLHHLVFDNHVALEELCALPQSEYPATIALRSAANDVLQGRAVRATFWNSEKIAALRQWALAHEYEELFDQDALGRMKASVAPDSQLVRHSKFGRGTIVSETGQGESLKLEVEFEDGTRKLLLARFLERL